MLSSQERTELSPNEQSVLANDAISPATANESFRSPDEVPVRQDEALARIDPFQDLRRGLTEREWNSAGVRILILDRMHQLEADIIELKTYRSQYHEKDKEAAILREKLQQATATDMLFNFCLATGGIVFGLSTFVFDKGHTYIGAFMIVIGLALLLGPLLLRYYKKQA